MRATPALAAALVVAVFASAAPGKRPNVILIMADDLGVSDLGCYGGEIQTPNLDALAARGVRFTQFYSTPRCSPTRASLLTGLYPHQAGMGHLDNVVREGSLGTTGRLNDRSVTIAEVLHDAGYFTAMAGKWHLGQQNGSPPWQRGFERVRRIVEHADVERAARAIEIRRERMRRQVQARAAIGEARGHVAPDLSPVRLVIVGDPARAFVGRQRLVARHDRAVADEWHDVGVIRRPVEIDEQPGERAGVHR